MAVDRVRPPTGPPTVQVSPSKINLESILPDVACANNFKQWMLVEIKRILIACIPFFSNERPPTHPPHMYYEEMSKKSKMVLVKSLKIKVLTWDANEGQA
jgi:hypothetical protein